jgi:RNA polymerase sigma-70 factor (ECF subfamily)
MHAERLEAIASALARLPDEQRLAIERHHLQGASLSELAQDMNRSKEAVASLLYRALSRLRRELAADHPESL